MGEQVKDKQPLQNEQRSAECDDYKNFQLGLDPPGLVPGLSSS